MRPAQLTAKFFKTNTILRPVYCGLPKAETPDRLALRFISIRSPERFSLTHASWQ
jgi:hypothetical protein